VTYFSEKRSDSPAPTERGRRRKSAECIRGSKLQMEETRPATVGRSVGRLSHRCWLELSYRNPLKSSQKLSSKGLADDQRSGEQIVIKRENLKVFEKVRDFCGIMLQYLQNIHEGSLYSRKLLRPALMVKRPDATTILIAGREILCSPTIHVAPKSQSISIGFRASILR
jgi:hypothetical protein